MFEAHEYLFSLFYSCGSSCLHCHDRVRRQHDCTDESHRDRHYAYGCGTDDSDTRASSNSGSAPHANSGTNTNLSGGTMGRRQP